MGVGWVGGVSGAGGVVGVGGVGAVLGVGGVGTKKDKGKLQLTLLPFPQDV